MGRDLVLSYFVTFLTFLGVFCLRLDFSLASRSRLRTSRCWLRSPINMSQSRPYGVLVGVLCLCPHFW